MARTFVASRVTHLGDDLVEDAQHAWIPLVPVELKVVRVASRQESVGEEDVDEAIVLAALGDDLILALPDLLGGEEFGSDNADGDSLAQHWDAPEFHRLGCELPAHMNEGEWPTGCYGGGLAGHPVSRLVVRALGVALDPPELNPLAGFLHETSKPLP